MTEDFHLEFGLKRPSEDTEKTSNKRRKLENKAHPLFLFCCQQALSLLPKELKSRILATITFSKFDCLTSLPRYASPFGRGHIPDGFAISKHGTIFLSDSHNCHILTFTPYFVFTSAFGSKGNEPNQFDSPRGLALDNDSNIVICDLKNHRIQTWTHECRPLSSKNLQWRTPTAITISRKTGEFIFAHSRNYLSKFAPKSQEIEDLIIDLESPALDLKIDEDENIIIANKFYIRIFNQTQRKVLTQIEVFDCFSIVSGLFGRFVGACCSGGILFLSKDLEIISRFDGVNEPRLMVADNEGQLVVVCSAETIALYRLAFVAEPKYLL